MIMKTASKVERTDIAEFAWFSLRTFHNVKYTTDAIVRNHGVPAKYLNHAEKQADQIRFFLLQSKEYFDASRSVTLVTRPVLLYYSAMCLATAEALFKQSGDSSIDRARASHRHHGLVFTNRNTLKTRADAAATAGAGLIAQPATRGSGERFGTFELWHKSARGYPITGITTQVDANTSSQTEGIGIFGNEKDVRMGLIPASGMSLNHALSNIPGMFSINSQFGVSPSLVRSTLTSNFDNRNRTNTTTIVIHPGDLSLITNLYERFMFDAKDGERVSFRELPNGGILDLTYSTSGGVTFEVPACTSEKFPYTHFFAKDEVLNEFGFIYVALYIAGNYARYYPDFWIYDVEQNTQLGLLMEHLLEVAEQRIALLALSALSQNFYIPA